MFCLSLCTCWYLYDTVGTSYHPPERCSGTSYKAVLKMKISNLGPESIDSIFLFVDFHPIFTLVDYSLLASNILFDRMFSLGCP